MDIDGAVDMATTLTLGGNADFNGNLDVDGQTDLDVLNVAETATFSGLLDANNNAQINSLKVEDLTNDRVVIAGSGGELEDDSNLTFDGSTLSVGVNLNVGVNLDVDGDTTLDKTTVDGTLTASDITVDNVQINGNTVQATSGDLVLTAPGGVIDINDALDISDNLVVRASATSNSASTGALQVTNGGAGIKKDLFVGQDVRCAGDVIAFYSSDERLKDNITPIADAVNKVKSISGNTFEWNENSNHNGEDTGVIAQEIEALGLPGVTKKKDNGYLGVRYEKLVPLLIEAIKELSDKVDDLEQKLSDK